MEIKKDFKDGLLNVEIEGRIDSTTAPELENELDEYLKDAKEVVMDFTRVAYISSAGLRVLLATQKVMNKQGTMCVKGVNEEVKEIFDVTGFSDILTIVD